jgi:hypothetical protein
VDVWTLFVRVRKVFTIQMAVATARQQELMFSTVIVLSLSHFFIGGLKRRNCPFQNVLALSLSIPASINADVCLGI